MFETLGNWLFDASGLTAHGFCLLWQPGLIWTYALSDTAIALAYFSIPLALAEIARKRADLVFRPLLWLFAAFILLCGTTHWLEILTLWVPAYGMEAVVKAATALVSVFTAVALWRLLPLAVTLPSPAQYREANAALQASQERLVQSQKMEVVGQLTGGVAHDFNNILQVLTSGLALMERRVREGRASDAGAYIPAMRQATENAAALTHRLLAFSRRQALQPKVIDPARLLADMEALIGRTLGPFVALRLSAEPGLDRIYCDGNQLESALLNLSVNARDAMPQGGSLTLAAANRTLSPADVADQDGAAPGRYVEFSVADDGEGMAPEVAARAFEPFFTTKPAGKGTGLGLSQVYGFVKQSGGFVRIESARGAGATVRVLLPAYDGDEAAKPAPAADSRASFEEALPAGLRVLLVEDQESIRLQLADALVELGCVVEQAADGLEGLRKVHDGARTDILVTDVGLPGLNGRELAEAVRAALPGLPILFISGFTGGAVDDLKLAEGMALIGKPFSIEEATAQVRALLAARATAPPRPA